MADFVFNIAKGRVTELMNRVNANDPTNSALIVVAINTSATDGTLQDLDTLALVLANGDTAEVGNTGYSREVITNPTVTTNDTDNRTEVALAADIEFGAITDDDVDWTDLVLCYDPDTTGGDDTAIVPLCQVDFPITIDGSAVTATAGDFFRAG